VWTSVYWQPKVLVNKLVHDLDARSSCTYKLVHDLVIQIRSIVIVTSWLRKLMCCTSNEHVASRCSSNHHVLHQVACCIILLLIAMHHVVFWIINGRLQHALAMNHEFRSNDHEFRALGMLNVKNYFANERGIC
jgi:hypothetical protein